jgi:opacity protein-like surface antigen
MNRTIISASAGLIGLAIGALPATAGDWNNGAGSLKDRSQAVVPVPAPQANYEPSTGWYMRLDAGIGRDGNHGGGEKGVTYGAGNGVDSYSPTGAGFGSAASWMKDDAPIKWNGGVGIGYSWGYNLRSDVTLDRRAATDYTMRGSYQYNNMIAVPLTVPVTYAAPATVQRIDGTVTDSTSLKSGVLMLNTYYDWRTRSAFTPYAGFGVGFAYLDMRRQNTTSDTSCDMATSPTCSTRSPHASWSGETEQTKVTWAAAGHLGISYAFSSVTSLDVNYRLLYIPSTNIDMALNGSQSRFTLNDTVEHQLRAGLRWNIN